MHSSPAWLAVSTALAFTMGCAGAVTQSAKDGPGPAVTTAVPAATAGGAAATQAAPAGPEAWPELDSFFVAERVTGTIALFDTQGGVLGCSNVEKCNTAYLPASTFKIPHSMVALEAGVVEGPDTILPWDRQDYSVVDWNQDLRFREAFRLSCLPCYRAIARRVGQAAEQDWVNRLDYGNRDSSGGVDMFWVRGGLRITPLQQIDFLRRFDGNRLPISERTADLVRDIMTLDVTEDYVLRAKTGSAMPPDEPHEAGWFVGWLERGERRIFFALLIDGHAQGVDVRPLRRVLTERVLRSKGLL